MALVIVYAHDGTERSFADATVEYAADVIDDDGGEKHGVLVHVGGQLAKWFPYGTFESVCVVNGG